MRTEPEPSRDAALHHAAACPYGEVDPIEVEALTDAVLASHHGDDGIRALAWALRCRHHHRHGPASDADAAALQARTLIAALPVSHLDSAWAALILDSEEGRTLALGGHPDQALPRFQAARDRAVQLDARRLVPLFSVYVGNALTRLGVYDEALSAYEEALAALVDDRAAAGTRGLALHNLAVLYGELGDLPQAIATCQQANEVYGGTRAAVLDSLALFLAEAGRFEEALATAHDGVALARSGTDGAALARTLTTLGSVLIDAGRQQEALIPYTEAMGVLESVDFAHGEMAARSGLAAVHNDRGDGQAALDVLAPLFAPGRAHVDDQWRTRILRQRAQALRLLDRLPAAFDLLEQAHALEAQRVRAEAAERLARLRVRHDLGRAQRVATRMARAREQAELQLEQSSRQLSASLGEANAARFARDELEAQLLAAQRLQAVGLLAGGIAHDFNNLLTVTLAYLDLLELDALPQQREFIEQARHATTRGAGLTSQLLALTRGKASVRSRVAIDPFVAEIGAMLGGVLEQRVSLAVTGGAPGLELYIDPGHLEQILLNLVINARDAIEADGAIEVQTETTQRAAPWGWQLRYARISVIDTGVGMPTDILERVTEPLFTTKEAGRGTGLGLSTVATIVRRMGGVLSLTSAVGMGTTVQIDLPAGPMQAPAAALRPARVIVLCADPIARSTLVSLLASQGLTALGADDMAHAKLHAQHSDVDLVVTPGVTVPPMAAVLGASCLALGPLDAITPAQVSARVAAALG